MRLKEDLRGDTMSPSQSHRSFRNLSSVSSHFMRQRKERGREGRAKGRKRMMRNPEKVCHNNGYPKGM